MACSYNIPAQQQPSNDLKTTEIVIETELIKKLILLLILLIPIYMFADEYEYSLMDYNSTSPTYGLNVWEPEYLDYITLHYFSTQG